MIFVYGEKEAAGPNAAWQAGRGYCDGPGDGRFSIARGSPAGDVGSGKTGGSERWGGESEETFRETTQRDREESRDCALVGRQLRGLSSDCPSRHLEQDGGGARQ